MKPRDDGFTPLHAAVLGGHENVVKLLLEKGATPDARYEMLSGPARQC